DLVDVLLPLVVALAGVALAVLVGEHASGGGEHRARDVVLRGDQPDLVALAPLLRGDQLCDFGVDLGERGVQRGMHGRFYGTTRSWPPRSSTPITVEILLAGRESSVSRGKPSTCTLRPM